MRQGLRIDPVSIRVPPHDVGTVHRYGSIVSIRGVTTEDAVLAESGGSPDWVKPLWRSRTEVASLLLQRCKEGGEFRFVFVTGMDSPFAICLMTAKSYTCCSLFVVGVTRLVHPAFPGASLIVDRGLPYGAAEDSGGLGAEAAKMQSRRVRNGHGRSALPVWKHASEDTRALGDERVNFGRGSSGSSTSMLGGSPRSRRSDARASRRDRHAQMTLRRLRIAAAKPAERVDRRDRAQGAPDARLSQRGS